VKKERQVPGRVEYPSVVAAALREGWIVPLLEAHYTATNVARATAMIGLAIAREGVVGFKGTRYVARRYRGRAYIKNTRTSFSIKLPSVPGMEAETLREGLALHEAAHVIDYWRRRSEPSVLVWKRKKVGVERYWMKDSRGRRRLYSTGGRWIKVQVKRQPRMSHGPSFVAALRELILQWKAEGGRMPICSDYRAVYARHQGPFSIMVVRSGKATKRNPSGQFEERLKGSMSAEDAHETARALIGDPRDPIIKAFVYSDTENAFIGAYYERGQHVPAWHEFNIESAAGSF
jgi:hypothetical protein